MFGPSRCGLKSAGTRRGTLVIEIKTIFSKCGAWHGDCYTSGSGGYGRPFAVQRLRTWEGLWSGHEFRRSKGKAMKYVKALPTAAPLIALAALPAFGQAPAPAVEAAAAPPVPVPDKGDTTWMLISTVLVLLMTIPGLALFYGGLVRAKNALSVLMQVFTITAVVMIIWVLYGYSLAFTDGGSLNPYVGGLSKAFLAGVEITTLSETFSKGVYIPELVFVVFQMTFACITPALIVGAFAERVKFSALLVFCILWVTLIYFPMAHMVWWWGGPDFLAQEQTAKLIAEAAGDTAAAEA